MSIPGEGTVKIELQNDRITIFPFELIASVLYLYLWQSLSNAGIKDVASYINLTYNNLTLGCL